MMHRSQRLYPFIFLALVLCLSVALVSSSLMTPSSVAQESGSILFHPYSGNPIIGPPESGDWDADHIYSPQILNDNNMWYAFVLGKSDTTDTSSLGLATSENGLNWDYSPNNPLQTPTDNFAVNDFTVHKSGDMWSLYFDGSDVGLEDTSVIRQAFTSNLNDGWIDAVTILTDGDVGMWDSQSISPSAVVENEDGFSLYYTGTDDTDMSQIGLATSSDNTTWSKYESPILNAGTGNEWDNGGVSFPSIWYSENGWEMFYTGVDSTGENYGIGYATSADGMVWLKNPSNPVYAITDLGENPVQSSIQVSNDTYFLHYNQSNGINVVLGTSTAAPISPNASPTVLSNNDVSPTPPEGPVARSYRDDEGDTVNCQNQEGSLDPEVDIAGIITQRTTDNTFIIQVNMVEPLVTDYSFAVLTITRTGETLNGYIWETHATTLRIGEIDSQTGALLDDQTNAHVEHDQDNGRVTFTIQDAEFEEFAIRSFHTPDEDTQPQPTNCDIAGPFSVE